MREKTNEMVMFTTDKDYLYLEGRVEIKFINSIESLSDEIIEIVEKNNREISNYDHILNLKGFKLKEILSENIFFRGHSNSSYKLVPSIARENWKENEDKMYNELLFNNHEEFKEAKSGINILKKMQHYNLPTRLLDITRSMLTAFYFVVEENNNFDGEIIIFQDSNFKYGDSDTVSILSSLPSLTFDEKQAISEFVFYEEKGTIIKDGKLDEIDRLVDIIRREKPGFITKIKTQDLSKPIIVVPTQDNPRMVRQNAAFIICALNSFVPDNINSLRISNINKVKPIFIIKNGSKEKLRKKLSMLGYNKSTLFPEIESVATFIKDKYKKKKGY